MGLMAVYRAVLRGKGGGDPKVIVIDRVPERLEAARKIVCEAVDFRKGDAVAATIERNGGMVDRSVDVAGYQAARRGRRRCRRP